MIYKRYSGKVHAVQIQCICMNETEVVCLKHYLTNSFLKEYILRTHVPDDAL